MHVLSLPSPPLSTVTRAGTSRRALLPQSPSFWALHLHPLHQCSWHLALQGSSLHKDAGERVGVAGPSPRGSAETRVLLLSSLPSCTFYILFMTIIFNRFFEIKGKEPGGYHPTRSVASRLRTQTGFMTQQRRNNQCIN